MKTIKQRIQLYRIVPIIFLLVYGLSCQESNDIKLSSPGPKVAIIGLDGLSWHLLDPMIAEGRLPNLERCINSGVKGDLESFEFPLLISELIWTTIITGKAPEKHGIRSRMMLTDDTGDNWRIVNSGDRKCQAIWQIASEHGYSNLFVNFMRTYPPDVINGILVSDRAIYSNKGTVYPNGVIKLAPSLFERILAKLGIKKSNFEVLEPFCDFSSLEKPEDILNLSGEFTPRQMRYITGWMASEAKHVDKLTSETIGAVKKYGQPNLLGFYLHDPDVAQHLMYRYHTPERFIVSDAEKRVFADFLKKYMSKIDSVLGEILKVLDPETNVLIVSDHSLKQLVRENIPEYEGELSFISEVFPDQGSHAIARGVNIRALRATVNRILQNEGWHIKIADPAYKSQLTNGIITYWRLFNNTGSRITDDEVLKIAVNTIYKLRTTKGITLFSSVDILPEGIIKIHITADAYPEDNIIIEDDTVSARSLIKTYPHISGWHGRYGIINVIGPAFKEGARYDEGTVYDITPTVLYLLGMPVAEDMDGKTMKGLFNDDYLRNHEIAYIPTYETGIVRRQVSGEVEGEEKLMEKLRALGYIN